MLLYRGHLTSCKMVLSLKYTFNFYLDIQINSMCVFFVIDNEDFIPVPPTAVILREEEVSATVSVELVNDEVVEGSEVMFVRLALAANDVSGIQLAADTASVIIIDKDGELPIELEYQLCIEATSSCLTLRINIILRLYSCVLYHIYSGYGWI